MKKILITLPLTCLACLFVLPEQKAQEHSNYYLPVEVERPTETIVAPKLLAKLDKITSSKDADLMTEVLYFEARNQSLIGQLAVGHATLNRVKSSKFPDTLEAVAHKKARNSRGVMVCQYSYYCDGKPEVYNDNNAYMNTASVADKLINHGAKDFTNGATLYFNYDVYKRVPSWALSQCVVYLGKWGDHEFYDQVEWVNCNRRKPSRFSRTKR